MLVGDQQYLFDLGQRPFVAAARQVAIQRLECKTLVLRLDNACLKLSEPRIDVPNRLARLRSQPTLNVGPWTRDELYDE